jgi:hypothetical protein|tara:strand:+ start:241 stop:624 length:384 start_codon:yes stop_codon:yes gene_type:complete
MRRRWILRDFSIRNSCAKEIMQLNVEDETLEVTVKPYKKNRSLEQNDMFHAWCGSIADKSGHTKEEIKNILIETVFGTEEYLNFKGEHRHRIRQTSGMTIGEMGELIERATQIGIELGADVPEVTHG